MSWWCVRGQAACCWHVASQSPTTQAWPASSRPVGAGAPSWTRTCQTAGSSCAVARQPCPTTPPQASHQRGWQVRKQSPHSEKHRACMTAITHSGNCDLTAAWQLDVALYCGVLALICACPLVSTQPALAGPGRTFYLLRTGCQPLSPLQPPATSSLYQQPPTQLSRQHCEVPASIMCCLTAGMLALILRSFWGIRS